MTDEQRIEFLTAVKQRIRDGRTWGMSSSPRMVPKASVGERVFVIVNTEMRRFVQVAASFTDALRIFNLLNP